MGWKPVEEHITNRRDECGQIVYVGVRRRFPRCGGCRRRATWVAVAPYWVEFSRACTAVRGHMEDFADGQFDTANKTLGELEQDQTQPRAAFGCEVCRDQMEITESWYWFQLDPLINPPDPMPKGCRSLEADLEEKGWGVHFVHWLRRSYDLSSKAKRKPMSKKLRYSILERDNHTCQGGCGRSLEDGIKLHVDHIVAVSNGGTNDESNLQAMCADCNLGKGSR